MRFSLPDLFTFNVDSAKTLPSETGCIQNYVNVAALDAVSPSLVASCYLMPAGKTLYASRAARCLNLKVPHDPLNILARPIYTKHFRRCCIKHVKGLFVSRHFNSAISISPLHLQSIAHTSFTQRRTAASRRKHAFRYFDAKDDKSSPGTREGGRCDTADEHSVSRRADIVRPGCSREVVTKRRYTKRNNQNFTSEKFAKPLPVDFE